MCQVDLLISPILHIVIAQYNIELEYQLRQSQLHLRPSDTIDRLATYIQDDAIRVSLLFAYAVSRAYQKRLEGVPIISVELRLSIWHPSLRQKRVRFDEVGCQVIDRFVRDSHTCLVNYELAKQLFLTFRILTPTGTAIPAISTGLSTYLCTEAAAGG